MGFFSGGISIYKSLEMGRDSREWLGFNGGFRNGVSS